jgi:hypothetical protein
VRGSTAGSFLTRRSLKDKGGEKVDDSMGQFALTEEEKAEGKLRKAVTFEVKNWIEDKVVWTRDFPNGVPRYAFDNFSGRLIFFWRLGTDEGKAKLKENPAVMAQAAALETKRTII